MKLLFITQKMDRNDAVLGFVPGWITEFSKQFERISVICLQKGEYDLPKNVEVYSLGKEVGRSRLSYLFHFLRYIVRERKSYDAVFVHMNVEYVILGGMFWRLMGKKVVLWYNHSQHSLKLRLAMRIANVVCYTSSFSASALTEKSKQMPVGIDTEVFRYDGAKRKGASVLSLGRIAPIKRIDVVIGAVEQLLHAGERFSLSVVGGALPKDKAYFQKLVAHAREEIVFHGAVSGRENVKTLFNEYQFFVNASPAGLFDKTVFEAMACECVPLVSSKAFEGLLPPKCFFKEGDSAHLAQQLRNFLHSSLEEREKLGKSLREVVVQKHSLKRLSAELKDCFFILSGSN